MQGEHISVIQTFHSSDDQDLHFRFIGRAAGREFIVNVQFPVIREDTGERLAPIEQDFLIAKILASVIAKATSEPNPGLH